MNKLILRGNWDIAKAKLTDNDLRCVEGEEDELIGRLGKPTGESREELERVLRYESTRR
jgi:uncharacterized protein YjbJ (UPF0337 family)